MSIEIQRDRTLTPTETTTVAPVSNITEGVARNERIVGFSDGVFAIAITILVLELKIPETIGETGLLVQLPKLLPKFLEHMVSFLVLGIYWVGHHNMFLHIRRHNRVLLWLNILFLMWVAAMPFFSGLVVAAGNDPVSAVTYAGILILAGLNLALIWWYAVHNHRLVDADIDPALIRTVYQRVLTTPLLYLIAIGVAFINLFAAKIIFIMAIVYSIMPGRVDYHHHHQQTRQGE